MRRRWLLIPAVLMLSTSVLGAPQKPSGFVPKDGFVPSAETAIRIAEAVWIPIYGEKQIQSERPFQAILSNGVWTVTGTLINAAGGVAEARISKQDGRILLVTHGK